ncbi:hypothetical protein BsWGS_10140 [Bradybaena similaris]
MITKIVFFKVFPKAWKCCLLCQDVACFGLSMGLLLVACHLGGARGSTCKAGGFFLVFGFLDFLSSIAITGIALLIIQNPAKMSQLSTFRWQLYLSFVIPQKILTIVLAALPVSSLEYFDTDSPYTLACFSVRQEGKHGAAFGAVLIFIMWVLVVVAAVPSIILVVRFWAGSGTRVHASTPSLWQTQKIEQSRTLHKFSILELASALVVLLVVTVVVYTNNDYLPAPQWAGLLSLAGLCLLHVTLAGVQLFLWSGLCYDKTGQKKEPHHRLKQLELIRTEGPGKLRLKASWAAGKDVWKRGLLKVYGPAHIKAWAQEIVVLGLLRKSRSASVLNCLWTSNMNPYHEAMTVISGDIVTSDSRLTCLELTSAGTLQELLKTMDIPLPEACQRTILHDIAEGLSCLHDQNVLHRNLTSAAVYLKGSVQCLIIRAAIGDFEDGQIYGTLLTGSHNSTVSRKQFFLPDIRAYALVGIEMMICVCECRQKDQKRRTGVKESSSAESTSRQLQEIYDFGFQKKLHFKHSQSSTGYAPELASVTTDNKNYRIRRFDNPEVPYCVPGEPEYTASSIEIISPAEHISDEFNSLQSDAPEDRETATFSLQSRSSINVQTANEETAGKEYAEYNLDNNWKLQKRKVHMGQHEDNRSEEWCDTGNDTVLEKHKASKEATLVKKFNNFSFPNYSAFRALDPRHELGEQEVIEEDIERLRKNTFRNIHGHHQQGGYVTSITDDGREIFIPAVYNLKKYGENSSSGYGSCSGSTSMPGDQSSSAATLNSMPGGKGFSNTNRLHKTISVGTTSLVQDKILEVLPAVGDNEYTSNYLLRDLFKAKEDAKVNKLMKNYEDRIRNEQLQKSKGNLADYCPSINYTQQYYENELHLNAHDSQKLRSLNEVEHHRTQIANNNKKQRNDKLSPPQAASVHRIQRDKQGGKNADNLHAQHWNVRTSLKRSKARASLKKALVEKSFHGPKALSVYQESRGTRGKDVEQKYSGRHANLGPRMSETNGDISTTSSKDNTKPASCIADPVYSVETHSTVDNSLCSNRVGKLDSTADEQSVVVNHVLMPPERTLASAKSRPAPDPPAAPYSSNVTHVKRVSNFEPCSTDTDSSQGHGDLSFTSVEPPSTESDSMNPSSLHSHEMSIDKIESDMNDIINSNVSFVQSKSKIPPGLKLIDSGFDSASVSSDESCLCAAAALQIPEESSSLYPSDILSQGRCSCACSSCLGSIQGRQQVSSWQDSPDSESWDNSNSFSSYDTNMHRRKLPSKGRKHDPTECILAPDDKYPSPNHLSRPNSISALHSVTAYSTDKAHLYLPQAKEQASSSASESSTAISRRYRELIKRGVPLRVSIISGEDVSVNNFQEEDVGRVDVNTKVHTDASDNPEYKSRLQVGFKSNDRVDKQSHRESIDKSNRGLCKNSTTEYRATFGEENNDVEDIYNELSPIPSLEEIIKEIPDETGCFPDETKAFLNRPDSELSVKALQAVLSGDCYSPDGKPTQCPELVIDQLFSQHLQPRQHAPSLSVDNTTDKEASFHSTNATSDSVVIGYHGLVGGMDSRHVMYCQTIVSNVSLISIDDLLPVSSLTFHTMKSKLQKHGRLGMIGNQILDVLGMCWLNESPPTTSAILNHLTDPVTETEL